MPLGHKASNKILSNRFVNEEQSSILFYISLCIGIELGEIPSFHAMRINRNGFHLQTVFLTNSLYTECSLL